MMTPNYLQIDNTRIAYHHTEGEGTGILFLGGFMSNMQGSKALALESYAKQQGWQFTRFDYGGHGASSCKFEEGTIGTWKSHASAVLEQICKGKQILVGSSMGGWIALLLALTFSDRVAGLVGIAAAPDFTEVLMWEAFSPQQKQEMEATGRIMIKNCMPGENDYPITCTLIEEGRNHCLLKSNINISCPIHLIHGMKDPDVPWETALKIADKVASKDVKISLIKQGDHRLSTEDDLAFLCESVRQLRKKL